MVQRRVGLAITLFTLLGLVLAGPAAATGIQSGAPAAAANILAQTGNAFIHMGTNGNTAGEGTVLDDPSFNGQFSRKFLATMQLQAEGSGSPRDNHPVNSYVDIQNNWDLVNGDGASMPLGTAWNIFVPPVDDSLTAVITTLSNTVGDHLVLTNPLLNGDPNARLFVMPSRSASALAGPDALQGGEAFTHTLAVAYDAGLAKWTIRTADGAPMPLFARFVVLKASPDESAFTTISSDANHLHTDGTAIDNPLTNGNPDALILVTQNFGTGVTNQVNNHFLGVWYDTTTQRWLIFNQDVAPMTNGIMFNVLVIPPKAGFQLVRQGAVANYKIKISNTDLDGNPYARLYVMHTRNPPESDNERYDSDPIGVFFDVGDQHWYLYNRDSHAISSSATFNLYYTWPRGNSFTISASPVNTTTATGMTLNSPLLNYRSSAVAIASYTKYPNAVYGADYSSQVGALYGVDSFWHLFNNGGPAFPPTLSFNVLAAPANHSFVVVAITGLGGNASGNALTIDNPLTNNDPWAMLFVTPRATAGSIDEHPLGVYWTGNAWAIYNEDLAAMATGQAFNVFVVKREYVRLPLIVR